MLAVLIDFYLITNAGGWFIAVGWPTLWNSADELRPNGGSQR